MCLKTPFYRNYKNKSKNHKLEDNMHKMTRPVFWKKNNKTRNLLNGYVTLLLAMSKK